MKRLPALKLPKLRLVATVGDYYRVEIHGQDDLRDGPCNYTVMNIGIAWTREEALQQARAWFESLVDDTPRAATTEPEHPFAQDGDENRY